jgi:hypothetical protein
VETRIKPFSLPRIVGDFPREEERNGGGRWPRVTAGLQSLSSVGRTTVRPMSMKPDPDADRSMALGAQFDKLRGPAVVSGQRHLSRTPEGIAMTHRPWKTVLVLLALASTGVLADGTRALDRASLEPVPADVTLPSQCLGERNHGACVNCCKALADLPGFICSHFCNIFIPPLPEKPKP